MIRKINLTKENYIKFFLKRILKIIPELLISLLVAAFIITPIVLKIPFLTYLKTPSYYFKYIFDNIILIKPTIYSISNVFNNLPYPNVLNQKSLDSLFLFPTPFL